MNIPSFTRRFNIIAAGPGEFMVGFPPNILNIKSIHTACTL